MKMQSREVIEYLVLSNQNLRCFMDAVNQALKDRFIIFTQMQYHSGYFMIEMVKYADTNSENIVAKVDYKGEDTQC